MPPNPIIDTDTVDPDQIAYDLDDIRSINRQRYEMEQLDGILRIDEEDEICIGIRHVRDDEFWVEGHVPGNPLLPGCLIVETAAQLCSFYHGHQSDDDRFIGFGGLEDVRFRAPVKPGNDLIVASEVIEIRSRRMKFRTQAFLLPRIVYSGVIIGMPMAD